MRKKEDYVVLDGGVIKFLFVMLVVFSEYFSGIVLNGFLRLNYGKVEVLRFFKKIKLGYN